MPQIGEVRKGASESVRWDGARWQPQGNPNVSAVPASETDNPWIARMKGFLSGAASGLPNAAKIVQVAAPFVTGGASIPLQMAIGGGTQALADLTSRAAGNSDAPQTFSDLLLRAAEGAAIPGVLGGAMKGIQAIRPLATKGTMGGVGGAMIGGYEGGKRGGVTGALEGAALGAAGGSTLANKFASFRGLSGAAKDAEQAVPAVEREMGGFASQPKATYINRPNTPFTGPTRPAEDMWPARETAWAATPTQTPTSMSPRVAGKAPVLNDELNSILTSLKEPAPPTRVTSAPSTNPTLTPVEGRPAQSLDMVGEQADAEGRRMAQQFPWNEDPTGIEAGRDRVMQRRIGTSPALSTVSPDALMPPAAEPGLELPDSWKPFTDRPSLQGLSSDIPEELSAAIDAAANDERLAGYPSFSPRKMPSFFKGPGTYPKTGRTPAIHSAWEP
jgi:hypothetical protein